MDEIRKQFQLTAEQDRQFVALEHLYAGWNAKINVISRKDMELFYGHHVLHSLAIAKAVQFAPGSRVLDLGTGGGFPGIPLAILFPRTTFLLVDSVGKKLKVVDDVARQLGLKNVTTLHERVENVPGTFDFVVSRAVTRLDTAWGWISAKIAKQAKHDLPNGLLYLKGGQIADELPPGVQVDQWDLSEWFTGAYFVEKGLVLISQKHR